MDTPPASIHTARERARHPPYTRASSRSSTSATSDARMSNQHSDRSVSNLTPSPQPLLSQQHQPQRTSHLVHRFQNGNHARPTPSPTSTDSSHYRSTRAASEEPNMGSEPMPLLSASSSYLQEKLLRERKVESKRSSSRMSGDLMSASVDLRTAQSSPLRSPVDGHRPRSSGGAVDSVKKKGISLKEMEQTLTTLHKQNFDLKLELYHRREKQTALEEQCETLETEKRETEELNDKLMTELEMRDKAVEEAVSMIISLEARLEELLREREIEHQAQKDRLLATDDRFRRALSSALRKEVADNRDTFDDTPKQRQVSGESQRLSRMPSFLSERSGTTENLRNVYLSNRGGSSLLSLPHALEDTPETDREGDRDALNRIGSPNLSVLSESSFLSIYGKKNDVPEFNATSAPQRPTSTAPARHFPRDVAQPPPDIEFTNGTPAAVVAHALATTAHATATDRAKASTPKTSTPTKKRSGSISHSNAGSGRLNSLPEFIGTNSPLQRLEKMEKSLQAMNDASRPASQEDPGLQMDSLTRQLRSHDTGKLTSKEKRDNLRRVHTDGPFAGDVTNSHNLPPTPDTISTSTLRRYKNSNETLSQEKDKGALAEKSYLTLSESTESRSTGGPTGPAVTPQEKYRPAAQPAPATFNSRRNEASIWDSYFDNPIQVPPRPRSADETTLSYHGRGSGWGDSESSDDDMELDGNDSASMHDYWLRESLRPSGQPSGSVRSRGRRTGRISPDLFNFPATVNGWATTTMFGNLNGQGYLGSGAAPFAQALDALGDSLPTPANGMFGTRGLLASPLPYGTSSIPAGPPPPPNRRSSLHAQTGISSRSGSRRGSIAGTPVLASSAFPHGNYRRSPTRAPTSAGGHGAGSAAATPQSSSQEKSNRPNAAAAAPTPTEEQPSHPKQRHYPPASSSNTATTRGSRVLSIFRRSGSHEPSSATAAPSSAPATETTFAAAAASKNMPMPAIGIPSRVRRGDFDDDNVATSATPPPILRNPRAGRGSTDSGSNHAAAACGHGIEGEATVALPAAPKDVAPARTPAMPASAPHVQAQHEDAGSSGPRKKWLGLGRVASLRPRAS